MTAKRPEISQALTVEKARHESFPSTLWPGDSQGGSRDGAHDAVICARAKPRGLVFQHGPHGPFTEVTVYAPLVELLTLQCSLHLGNETSLRPETKTARDLFGTVQDHLFCVTPFKQNIRETVMAEMIGIRFKCLPGTCIRLISEFCAFRVSDYHQTSGAGILVTVHPRAPGCMQVIVAILEVLTCFM